MVFSKLFRFVLTVAFAAALAAPTARAAQAQEPVRISIPMGYASMGVNYKRIFDTFTRMMDSVTKKTGTPTELLILPSWEESEARNLPGNIIAIHDAKDWVRNKKTELVYLYPEEYFLHPELRAALTPLLSWSVDEKRYGRACLFVAKDRSIQNAGDLKGGTINAVTDYVTVRSLLEAQGVDEPLWKFFGGFTYDANPATALTAILNGDIDAAYMGWQKWLFVKLQSPDFKNIEPVFCKDREPLVFLAVRKDVPKESVDRLTVVMGNAKKDPAFRTVHWFFQLYRGGFFRLSEDYLSEYETWFAKAEKKGWVKEATQWFDERSPAAYRAWVKAHNKHH